MEILRDDGVSPLARSGHVAVTWRDHMYIWSGYNHVSTDYVAIIM